MDVLNDYPGPVVNKPWIRMIGRYPNLGTVGLSVSCIECGKNENFTVKEEKLDAWIRGELIQNAFPTLTVDERELLISGICGTCPSSYRRGSSSY